VGPRVGLDAVEKKNNLYAGNRTPAVQPVVIPQRQDIFLSSTSSRPALGTIQPPIHWVPGVLPPGREVDCSPPSSAEVKNGEAIPPLPHKCSSRSASGTTLPFSYHEIALFLSRSNGVNRW
jgi:hypothetical protein